MSRGVLTGATIDSTLVALKSKSEVKTGDVYLPLRSLGSPPNRFRSCRSERNLTEKEVNMDLRRKLGREGRDLHLLQKKEWRECRWGSLVARTRELVVVRQVWRCGYRRSSPLIA